MIIAVILSAIIGTLSVLMITVGTHTDQATSRGKNFVQSLHVAEAGIEQAIARIEASNGAVTSDSFTQTTAEGDYDVTITKPAHDRYVIESVGGVRRGKVLGAERGIRVTLEPPLLFEDALFSFTTVETKNNDLITGDVWANHNAVLKQGTILTGSVTAATGYVELESGVQVTDDVVSGGYDPEENRAVFLDNLATVGGDITAAVVPVDCVGADNADYKIQLDNGSVVSGDVTTWGSVQGSGIILGSTSTTSCEPASATKSLPTFSYDPNHYDAATLHEFGSATTASVNAVSDFQAYVAGVGNRIQGTFFINQADPINQGTRVDLTGVTITGDTTIITNTPIFTNGTDDDTVDAVFTLVSTYQPPAGSACDVNQDGSECSIHLKNNLDVAGTTAVLVFSPFGPVAIKNNAVQFGAVYADGIQVKNNQTLVYDDRVERTIGFGPVTFEISKWEEFGG